jgi:ABC-type molybdenum transport system, ATPase component/photorepair protein PhrA
MTSDTQIVLELCHASVVKNDRRILDDLNLVIREGEHTAIVGPNGAGKSSLMKLLTLHNYAVVNRDGPPAVRVFGRDRWNVFELRALLGIVSSDLHHSFVQGNEMGRITGHTAVVSGFFASQGLFFHQDVSDEMSRRASAALARMRASHLAEKPLDQMSTGEARRVLIARALVVEPRALVLDEPTTGLDIVARYEFMQLVRSIAREGTTVIIVTHHIDEIIPEIERVVLLQQGRITHNGPKSEVLTSENLSQTFGAPIRLQSANGYYSVRLEYGNDSHSHD